MQIRVLVPDDAADFAALRLLGLEQHPEAFATAADDWRKAPVSRAVAQLGPDEVAAGRLVVGALEGAMLVGLVGMKREGRESVRHKASLWGLFVRPEFRRRGVGGALLDHAIAGARFIDGLEYLRVVVTTSDADALRLFESKGFARYGFEARGLRVGERVHDQAFLRLDLR